MFVIFQVNLSVPSSLLPSKSPNATAEMRTFWPFLLLVLEHAILILAVPPLVWLNTETTNLSTIQFPHNVSRFAYLSHSFHKVSPSQSSIFAPL